MSESPDQDASPPDLTGRTIGDFQVLRKLGQGGMGQVYLARQLSLKRDVALKILRDDLAANPTALKRFQAEAEAVARVAHTNIVQVFAVGEQEGLRYMALEFVDGRNLRDYLARKGPPDLPIAISLVRQVAAALHRASELGLVHRDIKPENILITRKAEVKVADFGLSRYFAGDAEAVHLTQSGETVGTPLYMSPEQVQGSPVDHRSDIYSLGVTSYHLLAGRPPFTGTTPFDVAVQHVQADPPALATVRPDLPADLCAVVHKMMAKRPEDRYQTARDVIRDLARVQQGLPVATMPVHLSGVDTQTVAVATSTAERRRMSGPGIVFAVIGMVVFAVAGWGLGEWLAGPDQPVLPASPGLPTSRPPGPVMTAREQELQAVLQSRSARPNEVEEAALELGLLYVHERRLTEAEAMFRDIEQNRFDRPGRKAANSATFAGRLGRGIVLALRDRATESNELITSVLVGPPRLQPVRLEKFFVSHPAFAQATADAVDRNAANLGVDRLPDRLEWLRTPTGIVHGPRG